MTLPSARDWLFTVKAFFASMAALYIALSLDLPRPYWAMAAVYVVANPLAGATSSKGVYRAAGTLMGAAAAVFLTPVFVNAPELFSVVVALWTGSLLYVSMLDRTPRSYAFMLAGYSLPLIALPNVLTPELVFDTALARFEEIVIGITCASVVDAVVFPTSVRAAVSARIETLLADAASWADEILRGEGAIPVTPLARQKLAADIASLDLVISHLAFDSAGWEVASHARELRGKLLVLLPVLSSLADRLHALKDETGELPAGLRPVLLDVAATLKVKSRVPDAEVETLLARVAALEPADSSSWDSIVLSSALARLKEVVDLWHDCRALQDAIEAGSARRTTPLRSRRAITGARHYDHALLFFSTAMVVCGTLVSLAVWIATGWASGAGFATMAAVACSFFAAQDQPVRLLRSMLVWCAASVVVAGVYVYGILPMVHDYEMLALVFAPPFLLLGLLIPRPQFTSTVVLVTVNTASFIALQNRYAADFATFANEGLASTAGIVFALVWTLATRPFGAELAARRLVRNGWMDLAQAAAGTRGGDAETLAARILDRLGQLVPRLAAVEDRELSKVDGFAEVRVGFNVVELQRARVALPGRALAAVNAALAEVAALYRERLSRSQHVEPSPSLEASIDAAMRAVHGDSGAAGPRVRDALIGIRRVFFPDRAPGPDWPTQAETLLAAE